MGTIERKISERGTMKEMILKAALDLYLESDWNGISIRKIANRIAYSPATIYLYYASKDFIVSDIQKLAFRHLLKEISYAKKHRSSLQQFRRLGMIYIDFGIKHPKQYTLMFTAPLPVAVTGSNLFQANFQKAFAFMHATVEGCVREGIVKYSDTIMASLHYWSMLHGLVCSLINRPYSDDSVRCEQAENLIYRAWDEYVNSVAIGVQPENK